ncbi:hypothetical protein LTR41_000712 [Exophiala xenobiotica]|nr:hypothetical protein LTR41_000712 [Exophiala xenobiotica]
MREFSFLGAAERNRVRAATAAAGTASSTTSTFDFTAAAAGTASAFPSSTLRDDYWNTVLGYQPASSVIATPPRGHGAFITLRIPSLRQAHPQPQLASPINMRPARPVLSLVIPENAAEISAFSWSWSPDSGHPDAAAYSASEYGDDYEDNLSMPVDTVENQDQDQERFSLWDQVQNARQPGEGTYAAYRRLYPNGYSGLLVSNQEDEPIAPLPHDEDEADDEDEDERAEEFASLFNSPDGGNGQLPTEPVYQDGNEFQGPLPDYIENRDVYATIIQYCPDLIDTLSASGPVHHQAYPNENENANQNPFEARRLDLENPFGATHPYLENPYGSTLPDLEDADMPDPEDADGDADLPDYEDEDTDTDTDTDTDEDRDDEPLTPVVPAYQEDNPADLWWPNWAPGEFHYAPGQDHSSRLWMFYDTTDPWYPDWLDRED